MMKYTKPTIKTSEVLENGKSQTVTPRGTCNIWSCSNFKCSGGTFKCTILYI